jgi:hypothetical protein
MSATEINFGGTAAPRVAHLGETQITDASLLLLIGFQQLRWLNLAGTRMTGEGLEQLRLALPRAMIVCTIRPEASNGKQLRSSKDGFLSRQGPPSR